MHYRPIGLLAAVGVLVVLLVSEAPQRAVPAETSARPAVKKPGEVSLPKGLSPDRWTAIKRDITQRNLDVRELKDGKRAMATPSFRAEFREEGVQFTSHRETKGLPWTLACQWARLEGDGPGTARVSSEGPVATVETRMIDEKFENRIDGVEHIMRVREKAFAGDLMRVRLDVATDLEVVAASDTLVTFRNSEGEDVFEYRGLRVWDSAGKNLEARLEVESGDILVCVDTAQARFPVTIDPLWRNSNFTLGLDWSNDGLTDRQSLEYDLGYSMCLVGDVTGDGEADLAVGAPGYLGGIGAVFVYYGTGTDEGFDEDIFSIIPSYLGQEGMRWGSALASGLINDDAIPDLVIGAPGYDSASSENCGGVWVLAGSGTIPGFFPPSSQDPVLIGEDVAQAEFGAAVSVPGDLDDDAAADDDVVVGAPGYNSNAGRVYCYFAIDTNPYLDDTIQWFSDGPEQAGARFGASLSHFMGDYDGDGDEDLVVGGPGYDVTTSATYADAGIVYVFFGTGDDDAFDGDPWIAEGPEDAGAQFGFAVDMAGDPNGDTVSDVIIGSPTDDNGGTVYLYWGPPAAPPAIPNPLSISINGADQLGFSVAGTGADYDADGLDDFLAGAPAANSNSGAFYVLNYVAAPPIDEIAIVQQRFSPGGNALFGFSVVGTGDANDDFIADAAAGMPGYWAPMVPGSGGVLAIYDLGAVSAPPQDWLTFISWPDFGWSVAFAGNLSGGDDTANDMYGDVLIGAPNAVTPDATLGGAAYLFLGNGTDLDDDPAWVTYGEGDYGACVAGVGDVNGDGLPDIMVGDPGYTGTIGDSVGRAYLFLGVTDDLPGTCPDWVSSGDEQAGARFGGSIAGIGSVNNDSYDDVVIGAPEYDDTESSLINAGRIYVFRGDNCSLLESTPIAVYTGLVAWEYFGYSVAGVGDVNGDDDPDVLVGAPYYTDGGVSQYGAVFLFFGGDDDVGLPGTGYTAAGPQAGAFYGFSVAGRVDVNNDGLNDLVVGAPGYNSGTVEDTGRVYVYLGTASADPFASVYFNAISWGASTRMGSSVVGVGALPGDAYGDVVAGGPTAGMGMVILINGGASSMSVPGGLAGRLMATAIAPVPGRFGFSLAAGDVTGDGTPDVIIGAPGPLEPAYVQQAEGVYLFRGED